MKGYLKQLIEYLGYSPIKADLSKYSKTYKDDYTITVDFNTGKIDYPPPMTLGDKTTCHFEASENFVVLECVDRLLEKGYEPKNMTLEKTWGLGHRDKGKADVFICHPKKEGESDGKPFLIIECKTLGAEFEKEFRKTLDSGGQLLSYYQQEQQTEFLCLYTSIFANGEIRYTNRIIKIEDSFKGKNKAESFKTWKEEFGLEFKYNGIFDDDATPYNVELKPLKRKDLVHLQAGDSGYIYNQFAEILRHNVVSDKPNAFNKMFNLILAKFLDEDREVNEILDFQWLETDDDITLQKRLNDLYKRGMKDYLNKEVTDFSDDEQQALLGTGSGLSQHFREELKRVFTELRLYKNNEFSFKEVFNEKSFNDNAIVVKETVKLLQAYQLRYSHKQQFLSNFFELLLSNTLKQEAGQFFTPVPIAKFIVSSIPLKEITEKKIEKGKSELLPHVIDFAAGSGHFLTETMDELQHVIENLPTEKVKPSVKRKLINWQTESYEWARDYIYGIEKDYRLAKIAKVSCFLSGDGLANIIHADGLASFDSDEYEEAPLLHTKKPTKENQKFDVLTANPPYSVQAFIKTLPKGNKCFDLFDDFTEQSKEIEVLFIERAKQLLKDGGFAGIILPSSILNNAGIYTKAREILLKYFRIVAIVEFGSSTFMATGTNTIALFLERRNNLEHSQIKSRIENFFNNHIDTNCNGIENAFSGYVESVHQISLDDYISFITREPNETFKNIELYRDYEKWYADLTETINLKERIDRQRENIKQLKAKNAKNEKEAGKIEEKIREVEREIEKSKKDVARLFYEKVFEIEQNKMLYFFLALPQNVLLVKSNPTNNNDREKEFLGYKFSDRRGHEGISMFTDANGMFTTKLYNEQDHLDTSKVNSYIYHAFLNEPIVEIDEDLSENIHVQNLADMINFDRVEFEKGISLTAKKKELNFEGVWGRNNLISLRDIATLTKGQSITKVETESGTIPVIAGGKEPAYFHNQANQRADVITVSASGANAGFLNYFNQDIFASDCVTIRSNDENRLSTFLLFNLLRKMQKLIFSLQRGQAQPHVYIDDLKKLKIPILAREVQRQIVREIKEIEQNENETSGKIESLQERIWRILMLSFQTAPKERLGRVAQLERGRFSHRPRNAPHLYRDGKYPFIQTGDVANANHGKIRYSQTLNDEGLKVSRMFEPRTILVTIAANIGSTAILDYGACFPDSLVSIRPNGNMNIRYLEYFLRTQKEYLNEIAPQKAQKNINLEILSPLIVAAPQRCEQDRIIKETEKLENEISQLEIALGKLEVERGGVFQKYL